jgi:HEAT repeat protein
MGCVKMGQNFPLTIRLERGINGAIWFQCIAWARSMKLNGGRVYKNGIAFLRRLLKAGCSRGNDMLTRIKEHCFKAVLFCFLSGISAHSAPLEDTLQSELARLEAQPELLADFNLIEKTAQRFKAANAEVPFIAWMQEQLRAATTPMARVNLAWHLKDYPKALEELTRASETALYIQWKDRFKTVDRGQYLNLLAAMVKANPSNSVARLEWLDAAENLGDAERIAGFEQLLRPDAPNAFPQGKGVRNGTQFDNYFQLAFRLMRLYERGQKWDELRALGLRIARCENPFNVARWEYNFLGENAVVEEGCACLALAVQYASDKNYQAELLKVLQSSSWTGARAQLERRIKKETVPANPAEAVNAPAKPDDSWGNAPEGVKLLVSDENVLCLARDDQSVYAGHPWGVAIYDYKGKLVTRVLLGEAANCIAIGSGELWVGSPKGLFNIQHSEKGWSVSHLWMDGDVPQKERSPLPGPNVYYNNNGVHALAFEGEELWIGLNRGVQMLNTRTRELRTFSAEAMKLKNPEPFYGLMINKDSVQASSRQGRQRRYDRKSGVWDALPDITAGQPSQYSEVNLVNGTRVIGLRNKDAAFEQPFSTEGLDTTLIDDPKEGLRFFTTDGVTTYASRNFPHSLEGDNVFSILFDEKENWLCSTRGLTRISPDGEVLEKFTRADGLPGDLVWNGVKTAGKFYFACGWEDAGGGLTVYDPVTAVFTWYRKADGMDSSRLESVQLTANNQIRLTYGREYLRSGLNSDKRYRQCPPGLFDPKTAQFSSGGTPKLLTQEEAYSGWRRPERQPFPCLGGFIIQRYEHNGNVYLCGTRGLVITKPGPLPDLAIPEMQIKLLLDKSNQNLADAAVRKVQVKTPEELAEALKDPNPLYRANALDSVFSIKDKTPFFPLLKTQLHDPELRIRTSAFSLLVIGNNDPEIIPLLRDCLNEPDLYFRRSILIQLAKRDAPMAMTNLQEVLELGMRENSQPSEELYSALSSQLTPELMVKMMDYPIQVNNYEPYREALKALGTGLRRHPEVLPVLLQADFSERKNRDRWGPIRFAQEIIAYAGNDFVPALVTALTNQEPTMRANAARACGKMGATSAIPTLLKVLDMPNNPVRGPVVWALGELKADAALPRLIKIFSEIRPDEERKTLQTYSERLSQSQVSIRRTSAEEEEDRYQTWKSSGPPRQPQLSNMVEETLKSENILDAIGKIGPEKAQPFYRELALGKDARDRAEAAIPLGQASATDRATNIAILKTLAIDRISLVRVRASVGLLLLGEISSREFLQDRLRNGNSIYERVQIVKDLELLPREQLAFIANDLISIANSEKEQTWIRNLAQAQYDRFLGKNSAKK